MKTAGGLGHGKNRKRELETLKLTSKKWKNEIILYFEENVH